MVIGMAFGGCSSPGPEATPPTEGPGATAAENAPADDFSSAKSDGEDRGPVVVFLGDSLTAGYGLDEQQAFPYLVEQALAAALPTLRVVNAGISGDTTAGGLSRLDWLLRQQPDVLVVALGGNDGLRGLDPAASEENLRRIITRAQEEGARVLLVGMLIPPNYGPEYTRAFAGIYPRLAAEFDVPLVPFLLEGVAGDVSLNQADGIHPTAEGQALVAQTVLAHLEPLLNELGS